MADEAVLILNSVRARGTRWRPTAVVAYEDRLECELDTGPFVLPFRDVDRIALRRTLLTGKLVVESAGTLLEIRGLKQPDAIYASRTLTRLARQAHGG